MLWYEKLGEGGFFFLQLNCKLTLEFPQLERAYNKGESTVNVDKQRYVDFTHMLQRRVDDPDKVRKIKREVSSAAEESEAGDE